MQANQLILDRYQPIGHAGSGSFGTVVVAWDTRIQRKVAIKVIPLTEIDAARAALPGNAVPQRTNGGRYSNAGQSYGAGQAAQFDAPFGSWQNPWESGVRASDGQASGSGREYANQVGGVSGQIELPVIGSEDEARWMADVPGLDEARTAAMLQDANIVAVYDLEIRNRKAFLIMEYVEGVTLTQLLRSHDDELTLDVIAAIFQGVSHALEVAHRRKVLHLDIKPDNILINTDGHVKVTDFGLATLTDAQGHGTAGAGTIGYMPLEQIRQEKLDVRTDEWALASVMYEMLVGKNPFVAPDFELAQKAIEEAELVLPSVCWEGMSEEVDDIMFCALCPNAEGRYKKIKDFREDIMPFLGDVKVGCADLVDMVYEETHLEPRGDFPTLDEGEDAEADERGEVGRGRGRKAASLAVRIVGALILLAVAAMLIVNGQPIAGAAFVGAAALWWIILMKLPSVF